MTETTQRGLVTPSKGQSVGNSKDMLALWRQSIISVDAAIGGLGSVANLSPEALAAIEAFDAGAELGDATVAGFVGTDTATRTALDGRYGKRTKVVVGPTGDYGTITDALADFTSGNVDIELQAGTITDPGDISVSGVKNVTIRGQGREATRVEVPGPFLSAGSSSDAWVLRDFELVNTQSTNTDDGIVVDYPRRWLVKRMSVRGFGGSSIWYRGGIHSAITFNYIIARDSSQTNGYAGVRCDRSSNNTVATTFLSRQNYVGAGKQYGFFFDRTNIGCVFDQDIAELCEVGMRFEQCLGELRSPYTEANSVADIEAHDCSSLLVTGRLRDMPAMTWSAIAAADRRPLYVGQGVVNAKSFIYGPTTGPVVDATTAPSITWGSTSPVGSRVGAIGSLYFRTTPGGTGRVVFIKETGDGTSDGWSSLGLPRRASTEFNSASNSVNGSDVKHAGKMAWNTSTNRPVWATGSATTDPWVYADGTTAHTPS